MALDYETIQKLVYRFGGSVRYILTEDTEFREDGLNEQEQAITSIKSCADLRKCLTLKVDDKDIVHRVFYIVPDTDKTNKYELCLGSLYIVSAVAANLKKADEEERLKLFRWLKSEGQSRSTAGRLFESYCHGFLSSGVKAVARSLTVGTSNLQLSMRQGFHKFFKAKSDDEKFRNLYSVPDIPNLPAIDSYYIDLDN